MSIAAFELIETKALYDTILDLPHTEPLSPNYEAVGFESLLIIYNLGSITFFTIAALLLMGIMLSIQDKEFSVKTTKILRPVRRMLFWNLPIRFLNESFLVLLIGCLINLSHISFYTYSEAINSSIVFIVLISIIVFPFLLVYTLNRYFDLLQFCSIRLLFGAAYEDYDTRKGKIVLFNIILFYLRRASLAVTAIYMSGSLSIQIVVLFSTTLLQICIIAGFSIYKAQSKNRAEILNELFATFIMYGTFLFTDYVPEPTTRL